MEQPEHMTGLLQSHDKILMDKELFILDQQRKWFLEIESIPYNYTVKIVEVTIKDLEQYINLVNKAAVGFQRIDSSFERTTVGKML